MTTYFILGPTAIGKSNLAINFAQKVNAHIINADSMQVYKNLEILTARPNKSDLNKVEHHLYGHIDGSERYNVARWCGEVSKIINKCAKKNINSIVVGGTGMYIDKLINGIVDIPEIPEDYKQESEKEIIKVGIKKFCNIISRFDNDSLSKINKNDSKRLKRIWEVYMYTKIPFSKWIQNKAKIFFDKKDYFTYLFLPERKKNYEKVNNRFIKMINEGAINEVRDLIKLNLKGNLPIMKAHGVPEISLYLLNQLNLEECIKIGQKNTRNYVKRQHTWWASKEPEIHQKFNEFPDEINLKSINFI